MTQLVATARNLWFAVGDDGKLIPMIEGVLTVFDRGLEYLGDSLKNVEWTDTIRIGMSSSGARQLAANLNEWAEECEERAEQVAVLKKTED